MPLSGQEVALRGRIREEVAGEKGFLAGVPFSSLKCLLVGGHEFISVWIGQPGEREHRLECMVCRHRTKGFGKMGEGRFKWL